MQRRGPVVSCFAMPIRPAPWVAWVAEAESSDVSPPNVLRHALVLVGGATTLYSRQMPCTLRAPLCRLQELPLYAGADSFGEVAQDTQLVVFKSCSISDVWRDRDVIRAQLDEMNIVFLCADPRADDGQSARLARRLGMDASTVRPFYLVTNRDLKEAAERDDEDEERAAEVVEASAGGTALDRYWQGARAVLAEAAARRAGARGSGASQVVEASDHRRPSLAVLQQQLAAVRAYQWELAAGRRL